jgi:hypothetical protein
LQEVTPPVARTSTTTLRPLATLRRSLHNAAAGARLIQADGLDHKSATDVAASLADALGELHGSGAALIDVSDAIMDGVKHPSVGSLDS